MYPERLESEPLKEFWSEEDCFCAAPYHYVHAYRHDGYKTKMHAHEFYEMNVIVAGEGRHYIGETSLPARTGDVFVLPPRIAHGYFSEGDLDIFHVLFRSDFLARYHEELSRLAGFGMLFDAEPYLRRASGKNCNLHLFPAEALSVYEELERIRRAEKGERFVYENVLTLALIGRLGALLHKSVAGEEEPAVENAELLRVMEYLRNNLAEKLTLETIASFTHVSKATLCRRFKETLGVSPMRYVADCRLAKAKELIAKGAYNRTEIAQLCGFYDVAHMNKYLHTAK